MGVDCHVLRAVVGKHTANILDVANAPDIPDEDRQSQHSFDDVADQV